MTQQVLGGIESITQETVDFVKGVIMEFCKKNGLTWRTSQETKTKPANQLDGVRILKEQCNLEYPRLRKTSHFHSGVTMEVRVIGQDQSASVQLFFMPDHTPMYSLVDEHVYLDGARLNAEFEARIFKVLSRAMEKDTDGLDFYRQTQPPH